jgi:hypothetical protein
MTAGRAAVSGIGTVSIFVAGAAAVVTIALTL